MQNLLPSSGLERAIWNRMCASKFINILLFLMVLILFDQLTKIYAYTMTPSAASMNQPGWNYGLAWHIHQPNPYSPLLALLTAVIIGITCSLPIPVFTKVMWASAALSNHIEMLLRPGTIDFLAFGIGERLWVANVADIYFVLGTLLLLGWLIRRVRQAQSWLEPVRVWG